MDRKATYSDRLLFCITAFLFPSAVHAAAPIYVDIGGLLLLIIGIIFGIVAAIYIAYSISTHLSSGKSESRDASNLTNETGLIYPNGVAIHIGDLVTSREGDFKLGTIETSYISDSKFSGRAVKVDVPIPESRVQIRTDEGHLIGIDSPFTGLVFLERKGSNNG